MINETRERTDLLVLIPFYTIRTQFFEKQGNKKRAKATKGGQDSSIRWHERFNPAAVLPYGNPLTLPSPLDPPYLL